MTNAIGSSNWGLLGQLATNATGVSARLDTLTEQISSGLVSTTYAGLGASAITSLDLRPQIAQQTALGQGLDAATGQMAVTQNVMSQIGSIASGLQVQLATLDRSSGTAITAIASQARTALQQVASLLDTQDGDAYVFAGIDSANPPVPDPGNITQSAFYGSISAAVGSLSTAGASATESMTVAVASSNSSTVSPFSSYLSQPAGSSSLVQQTVRTGPGSSSTFGVLATSNMIPQAAGGLSTGSYMRDLMRTLATVGSMTGSLAGTPAMTQLVSDTASQLGSATTSMTQDQALLGEQQDALTATSTGLSAAHDALTTQLSNVEDVDYASASTTLSLLQTQLQSSYELIAGMKSLSLVSYLQ